MTTPSMPLPPGGAPSSDDAGPAPLPPIGAGRAPAAAVLRTWLTDPLRPRLCLVTGSPGSGKSLLVAWVAADDLRTGHAVHGMVAARGMTLESFTWALAIELSVPAGTPEELLAVLAADGRPATLIIGELDECGPGRDGGDAERIVKELLNPLLELQTVRLLVEARAETAGLFTTPPQVVQLDDPALTDADAFTDWVKRRAAGAGPDAVAAAQRACPHPGRALHALRAGSAESAPGDTAVSAESEPVAPVESDLPALVEAGPGALVEADPITVTAALSIASAEPPEPAESKASGKPGRSVLAAARLAWHTAGPALLTAADAAERAAVLRLAALHVDARELADGLAERAAEADWNVLWALPRTGDEGHWPGPVTALTVGTGSRDGQVIAYPRDGVGRVLSARDGSPLGRIPVQVTARDSSAHGRVPDVIAARTDAVVCFANGALLTLESGGALHLVKGEAPKSQAARLDSLLNPTGPVAGNGSGPQTDPAQVVAALESADTARRTALGTDPDVTQIVVGTAAGAVHAWDLASTGGTSVALLHTGQVTAVAALRGASGSRAVLSGGADGTVRLWVPGADPLDDPVAQADQPVTALATGPLHGRPVAAIAWWSGQVVLLDLLTGARIAALRPGFAPAALAFDAAGVLYAAGVHGVCALQITARPAED